jgi:hypothetical protein
MIGTHRAQGLIVKNISTFLIASVLTTLAVTGCATEESGEAGSGADNGDKSSTYECGTAKCQFNSQYCEAVKTQGVWQPGTCESLPSTCAALAKDALEACLEKELCPDPNSKSSRFSLQEETVNGQTKRAVLFGCTTLF